MPDNLTDAHHKWVADTFGVDPTAGLPAAGGAAGAAAPSADMQDGVIDSIKYAATTVENFVGDVASDVKIGAEQLEQQAEGLMDKAGEAVGDAVDAAKQKLGLETLPPTATPTGPITLTSQTEVSAPANRARTKLGVGERVTLKVTPGPGNWQASGAKLSSKSGSKVTLIAPDRPGEVDVTVTVGTQQQTLKFTVIAPSEVHQVRVSTEHYTAAQIGIPAPLPNAGFHADIYLGPDDVNFTACSFLEDEIGAKASGSWAAKNGEGHSPNKSPLGCTNKVVGGLGTKTVAQDHCWSGYVPGLTLTDWTGQSILVIPWHWACGSGRGLIARVTQKVDTDRAGSTTISKAGASFTAALS